MVAVLLLMVIKLDLISEMKKLLLSITVLTGVFLGVIQTFGTYDLRNRMRRSDKSELDYNSTVDAIEEDRGITAEDLKATDNEESRQRQGGGLGSLLKGLGFGGNKQQIDPYLMMLVDQLKKEKLSAATYDSGYDDLENSKLGLSSNKRTEEYGGSYGASNTYGSSYGGGSSGSSYGGSSYGSSGGSSYGSNYGGGYGDCCSENDKLIKLLVLGGLALLGFYLYLRTTTTAAAARKKRSGVAENDLSEMDYYDVTLDGPAWLSMIHELWQQDAVADNPYCAYETLCRMNRIAAESGGQGTWAAHLSSVPLSYLLHNRHEYGFQGYMNAALMGKAGANCTELYSGCSRLN
ncbi:uncharacterized protein LOC136031336 [Artemia franciscana]|uniref:uncharacterized protein LOC136031336 n=1 Tax=Artemia franciscana TaxID=6661 RepID=UPI0032D9F5AE